MPPNRNFKYDINLLLALVRDRPAIWDKSLEAYKDKIERKNAWDEICSALESTYEHMSPEDKKATLEHITSKWTNVRDAFVKTVRNRGKVKRKYMFHNQIKFLLKNIPEDEVNEYEVGCEEPSFLQEPTEYGTEEPYTHNKLQITLEPTDDYVPKKKTRRSIKTEEKSDSDNDSLNDTNNIDFVEVDSKMESDPRVMNEDEAFFASLLPTVVRYNESERLEFRIQVLSAMKKIKDSRRWQ